MTAAYYKKYRNYVTNFIRTFKRQYYVTSFESYKSDVNKTLSIINGILKPECINRRNTITKNIICDNCTYTEESDIADILNRYFTSIGTTISNSIEVNDVD